MPHILEELTASEAPFLDRQAVEKLFSVEERRARQILSQFAGAPGLIQIGNAAAVPRKRFLEELKAFAAGADVSRFHGLRQRMADQIAAAKIESAARQFRVMVSAPRAHLPQWTDLPGTLTWRRTVPAGPARFEILYDDGADLMWQLSEFLRVCSSNRDDYFEATEPQSGEPGNGSPPGNHSPQNAEQTE